jgi:hypothetical protein
MFLHGYGRSLCRVNVLFAWKEAEVPSLLFNDPLASVGPTMLAVLVAEVSHKTPRFEDSGSSQLGMLTSEINGPDTVAHVLQVAGCQRVTFVA